MRRGRDFALPGSSSLVALAASYGRQGSMGCRTEEGCQEFPKKVGHASGFRCVIEENHWRILVRLSKNGADSRKQPVALQGEFCIWRQLTTAQGVQNLCKLRLSCRSCAKPETRLCRCANLCKPGMGGRGSRGREGAGKVNGLRKKPQSA